MQVGLGSDDDTLARVGALQSVKWQVLKDEENWDPEDSIEMDVDDTAIDNTTSRGILVEITYEKAHYMAILLRRMPEDEQDDSHVQGNRDQEGFQHLPLLLIRMPISLRETFVDYLSTTFDTRVSPLKLEGKYLTSAFEEYVENSSTLGADDSDFNPCNQVLQKIIKEVQISIGFSIPSASALKTIDILIAREDLTRMISRGKRIGKDHSPFMAALAAYVKAHMALDLGHEMVKIVKIACGAFVLGEGRLKLTFLPSLEDEHEGDKGRANKSLVDGLVGAARGGTLISGLERS